MSRENNFLLMQPLNDTADPEAASGAKFLRQRARELYALAKQIEREEI